MRRPLALLPLLLLFVYAPPADAQFWEKVKDAAKRGAERAAERETADRADRAVTGAFDKADEVVKCAVTDAECARRAEAEGQEVVYVDSDGNEVDAPAATPVGASAPATAPAAARPGEGAWANYDFVPGDRVLFYDDFEDEYVGNVPRRFDFKNGVMEVVESGGTQMLRISDNSAFALPLPEDLPERFTIEFDAYSGDDWNSIVLGTGPLKNEGGDYGCFHGGIEGHEAAIFKLGSFFETGVVSKTGGSSAQQQNAHEQGIVPVRISVDGSYVKMYVGENRVANVPNADVQRTNRVLVMACGELAAEDDGSRGPILIDNIRVAAGGRESMYEKLSADGRMALGGLLFDTGSATLRPESTPTLQDLARTMERHGDLRVRIEGHTDSTGDAEANRRLSEQRAQSVRAYLTANGLDGSRIEAQGFGADNPVADNGTPEGRQTNRRVELVRL
jgi:outer membrane protein OmpA-like peptidoglycan-associated protein